MNFAAISFAQWQQVGLVNKNIYSVFADDDLILAGSDSGHIYRSTDEGLSWTLSVTNMPSNNIILSFINWGDTILAGAGYGTFGSCFGCGGVFRSTNRGLNWTKTSNGLPDPVGIPAMLRLRTKVLAAIDHGLYFSRDGGTSWSMVDSNALTITPVLAFSSKDSLLFAGTSTRGIFSSIDSGITWHVVNSGIPRREEDSTYYREVFSLQPFHNSIFAGVLYYGAFATNDFGNQWCLINSGLDSLVFGNLSAVEFASSSSTLFGATYKKVYYLRDGDTAWTNFSEGLQIPVSRVSAIKLGINWQFLFAGVVGVGKGVWRRRLSDLVSVEEFENPLPLSHLRRLLPNYPNPFNPSTTIKYDLPEPAKVSLIIYDVLGRKVAELVNEEKAAGYHSVTWSAANVASGVYLARFTASDANGYSKYSSVNKLVLMK